MKFLTPLFLAQRALRRNPLRSILTSLGIIIGTAATITLVGLGSGARSRIEERIAMFGQNLIMVFPGSVRTAGVSTGSGSATTLTPDDAAAIKREIPGVVAVSPELRSRSQVMANGLNWNTQITGQSEDFLSIRAWPIATGDTFGADEVARSVPVAVLGQTVARQLFPDGQAIGQPIRIRNLPFRVIGVLQARGATPEGMDQDDFVLIPYSTYMKRFTRQSWVRALLVQVEDIDRSEAIQGYIAALLADRHKLHEGQADFTINDQKEIVERAAATTDALTFLLASVAAVSLAVGGIGIMNIMLVSVTERTREIGVRLAVGAHGRDVLRQFLVEAVLVSAIGGILGVIGGFAVSEFLSRSQGWVVNIPTGAVLGAVGFSACVGIFFGYYPARRAASLDPIDALRFE